MTFDFRILFYYITLLLQRKMGSNKGKRLRKTEILADSVPEFELGDTAADIYSGGGKRQRKEKGRKGYRNSGRKP